MSEALARRVLEAARARGLMIATAESCTGGMVTAALTDVAGSSDVVDRGFITYSNTAKAELLEVPPDLIKRFGAVSEAVVRAMAEGALARSAAGLTVAVTGVAGPGGGTPAKPVGLVWFATAMDGAETLAVERSFEGLDRAEVRLAARNAALQLLLARLG